MADSREIQARGLVVRALFFLALGHVDEQRNYDCHIEHAKQRREEAQRRGRRRYRSDIRVSKRCDLAECVVGEKRRAGMPARKRGHDRGIDGVRRWRQQIGYRVQAGPDIACDEVAADCANNVFRASGGVSQQIAHNEVDGGRFKDGLRRLFGQRQFKFKARSGQQLKPVYAERHDEQRSHPFSLGWLIEHDSPDRDRQDAADECRNQPEFTACVKRFDDERNHEQDEQDGVLSRLKPGTVYASHVSVSMGLRSILDDVSTSGRWAIVLIVSQPRL